MPQKDALALVYALAVNSLGGFGSHKDALENIVKVIEKNFVPTRGIKN